MATPARATIEDLSTLGPAYGRLGRVLVGAKQGALNVASDYLDGRIGTQYQLPLVAPYPQDIIDFEVIFASYRLLLNVGFNPMPGNADEAVQEEYKRKLAWAEMVASGEVPIVGLSPVGGDVVSGPDVITATTRGYSERGIYPGSLPMPQVGSFSDD